MSHPDTGHQRIECSVVSCKYHDKKGRCSLERIQVEPTPMAYTGEAADESMCGSYKKPLSASKSSRLQSVDPAALLFLRIFLYAADRAIRFVPFDGDRKRCVPGLRLPYAARRRLL